MYSITLNKFGDSYMTGDLFLDYEDEIEEAHLVTEVSQCIFHDNKITINFSGVNDGDYLTGRCTLECINNNLYQGFGSSNYPKESPTKAIISAVLTIDKDGTICFRGTWQDEQDSDPYMLTIEISDPK